MLTGKTIVLGVTGSIAAYKIANLASMLVKLNADVHVIMTQNATHFITPMTFETLTNNKCIVDTFDRNFNFDVKHVSLAKRGDLFLVAPCTANVIGKVANGICDDMLTTTIMATKAPVLFSPAMNTGMWENPVLQDNLKKLQHYGYHVIEPVVGRLACGDTGSGKMPSEETLLEHILLIWLERKTSRASGCSSRLVLRRRPSIPCVSSAIALLARWAMRWRRWPCFVVLRSRSSRGP